MLLSATIAAQDAFYSIYTYDNFIPEVKLNYQTEELQQSLYPDFYTSRNVIVDKNWVVEQSASLDSFWVSQGDTVLHIIRELSGVEWIESKFDIYMIRYYPTLGSADPLILPVGGYFDGTLIETAPTDNIMKFNLIYQLSKRMLNQADRPQDLIKTSLAFHPLFKSTPYRRDNLAMLLAVNTSYSVLGLDSTNVVLKSTFWEHYLPGMKIFREYFENRWVLTPDNTLSDYVLNESYSSDIVRMSRTPQIKKSDFEQRERYFVENLPLAGRLGFSTRINDNNQLVIDKIDTYRLGYASGLLEGDIIRRVDNKLVRNHKKMVEYILESLDKEGSLLEISRDGKRFEILLFPFDDYNYIDNDPVDPNLLDTTNTIINDSL